MSNPMNDPRVFFAAERTLLAWIRTALTVIALGFVVGRMGLFLTIIAQQTPEEAMPGGSMWLANVIGMMLVVAGTVTLFMAAMQHRTFLKLLPSEEIPQQYHPEVALGLAFALSAVGLLIVLYLALTGSKV